MIQGAVFDFPGRPTGEPIAQEWDGISFADHVRSCDGCSYCAAVGAGIQRDGYSWEAFKREIFESELEHD